MGIDIRLTSHIAKRYVGRRVLETCTGGGFTTIALAREAQHVTTIEIEPDHQAQARQNVNSANLLDKVTFILGDALDENVLNSVGPHRCSVP